MFNSISNKYKSKNFDKRKKKISFIILHYTETSNLEESIKILTSLKKKVSSHFVIDFNGKVYNLVDLKYRAWHAGESKWQRSKDINSRSIGIEIVYPGENSGSKYPNEQIDSLIKLLKFLKKKFKIKNDKILGHSDIAPFRKIDPGIHFPWKKLAENSISLWVNEKKNSKNLSETENTDLLINLKKLGYPYIVSDFKNDKNKQIINSFHRHHLTKLLNKDPNKSSLLKTIDLLNLKKNID